MPLKPDADYSKTKTYLIAEGKHRNITTAAEILKAARTLISKPENWTQRAFARTKLGGGGVATSYRAVCFCTVGGLVKAIHDLEITGEEHPLSKLITYLETFITGEVADFNDSSTHAEVLELFDKAIAELNKPS